MSRVVRTVSTSLAAAAVGAGVALLFAPQSGQRTRRQIRRTAERYAQDLRDEFDERVHNLYSLSTDFADDVARRLGREVASNSN